MPPRYHNRYPSLERNEVDANERMRLKRVMEEMLDEGNDRTLEIKRLKQDRKELLHLKSVMGE